MKRELVAKARVERAQQLDTLEPISITIYIFPYLPVQLALD